jgi:hypothetical protein
MEQQLRVWQDTSIICDIFNKNLDSEESTGKDFDLCYNQHISDCLIVSLLYVMK